MVYMILEVDITTLNSILPKLSVTPFRHGKVKNYDSCFYKDVLVLEAEHCVTLG